MKLIKVLIDSSPLSESNHTSKSFLSPWEVIVPRISIEFNWHTNCHKECDDYYVTEEIRPWPMLIINKLYIILTNSSILSFSIYNKNSFRRTKNKIHDISLYHYSMCAIPLSCQHYIQCMYTKVLYL